MSERDFPRFTSSDEELNITYRYRTELYHRHIKETPSGHVISEFLPDVPWAGVYNTISCAAMHHFKDGRWMQNPTVLAEYAKFWCTEGNPRLYSFPIADSVLSLAKVTGDYTVADELYPELVRIHAEWDDHKNAEGVYTQLCDRDGMEHSISGDGARPTINSYMYAEKLALATLADRKGDGEAAARYREQANALRDFINTRLWNENIGMYGTLSYEGEAQNVREQIGYIPWIYGIPNEGKDSSFRFLLDPACFLAPHGLRTADASHPDYRKPVNHECLWNGPVWPFATAQTLTALAAYLQTAEEPTVTAEDYMSLLLTYAYSHRDEDGTPFLDENMDPDTGIWLARSILREWGREDKERGQHYNHSTFIDLVITGLVGIRPCGCSTLTVAPLGTSLDFFRAENISYHGHSITVDWKKALGLAVTVDGEREYTAPAGKKIRLEIPL